MTKPLQVDTDALDAASKILKAAASKIPMPPPKLSVPGTDPLSLAIARGATQVEAPMAVLPEIKANATAVAEKIGVAGQRYRETDEMLAEKARQQFDDEDARNQSTADPQRVSRGGGIGKYKTSPRFGKDVPTEPGEPSSQKSVTDTLLSNIADGGKSAGVGSAGPAGSPLPDKTDWILGGAGAAGQTFTDRIAELTRRGLAAGGDGASPTLKKAVEEIKNPFTFLGTEAPALGSKMGGGVGVIMSIPSIAKDVGEGNMSAGQAIAREGAGLVVGTAAAGVVSAVPAVGPALAIPTAIFVGTAASKFVDAAWVPLQEFGKAAADGGFKAARLGR